jgi:hypothetical protein
MKLDPKPLDFISVVPAEIQIKRPSDISAVKLHSDRRGVQPFTLPPAVEALDSALLLRQAPDASVEAVDSALLLRKAPEDSLGQRKRSRIAIVGLYNSGSTVVADVLSALGVHFGRTSWANEDESMATFLAKAWDEPWGNPKIFSHEQRVQRLHDWMVEQEASTSSMLVGLKHPLLSLSGPDLLSAWGNDTTFVWAHRPLNESIAGLNRRSWFDYTVGMAEANKLRADFQTKLWRSLRAFFECGPDGGGDPGAAEADAAGCREHRPLVVSYADLLGDADGVVRRIAGALGLDPSEEEISRAAGTVHYQTS